MAKSEPNFFYLNIDNRWPGFQLTNLEIAADGALQLRALPRLVGQLPEKLRDLPTPQAPAGIARTDDGALFFTEPEHHLLWRIDPCDVTEMPRPSPCLGGEGDEATQFRFPRGLLFLPGRGLLIADSGNHRLQIVDPLTGQVRDIWEGFDANGEPLLNEPWALAADRAGNVYVVTAGDHTLQKRDRLGRLDSEFGAKLKASATLIEPVAVAVALIDDQEYILVLDRTWRAIVVFSLTGQWQKTFIINNLQDPLTLAVSEQTLYIGDNGPERQTVLQFDLPKLADDQIKFAGTAIGYQGPIVALFIDRPTTQLPAWCAPKSTVTSARGEQSSNLLLLAGGSLAPVVLQERSGYRTCGSAVAGPFDYRRLPVTWHRLQALMESLPRHAHARFFFFLSESPGQAATQIPAGLPAAFDPCAALEQTLANWSSFPPDVTDGLFGSARRPGTTNGSSPHTSATATYIWLGFMLSGDGTASPRVHQVRVQFNHQSYLPHLPELYSENEASRQFLLPMLSLFESFFAEHEAVIADLAALFDPAAAPPEFLDWLAGWLAQDLKEEWNDERKRHMIATAFADYAWRGVAPALRRRLQEFANIQAHILEPLLGVNLWSLGETSTLGSDTMLASAHPQGAVLGSTATLDHSHLITADQFGQPLFEEMAHQFVVQVYRGEVNTPEKEAEVRQIIERDKPAHTDYHLCFIEPRLRVGFQARVGIDTVVAGPVEALRLDEELRQQSSLGGRPAGRIGESSQVGISTRIY